MKRYTIIFVVSVLIIISAIFSLKQFQSKQLEAKVMQLPNNSGLCSNDGGCEIKESTKFGFEVGNYIPNFDIIDLEGNRTPIYDIIQGKERVILNLTVNWCSDCHREKQKLDQYYEELPSTYEVLPVYINYSRTLEDSNELDPDKTSNKETTIQYLAENNYTFKSYYDEDNYLFDNVEITHVPSNIVIDKHGKVKAHTEEVDLDHLFYLNSDDYYIDILEQNK